MEKQTAHLDGWEIEKIPGRTGFWLLGTVKNHPLVDDGKYVHTSTLQEINFVSMKAVTKNTVYTLGDPK